MKEKALMRRINVWGGIAPLLIAGIVPLAWLALGVATVVGMLKP